MLLTVQDERFANIKRVATCWHRPDSRQWLSPPAAAEGKPAATRPNARALLPSLAETRAGSYEAGSPSSSAQVILRASQRAGKEPSRHHLSSLYRPLRSRMGADNMPIQWLAVTAVKEAERMVQDGPCTSCLVDSVQAYRPSAQVHRPNR